VKLSLRTFLLLTLITVSLFASWQGISVTYAAGHNYGYVGVSSLCEPVITDPAADSADNEAPVVSADALPAPYDSSSNDDRSKTQWALEQIHALPAPSFPGNDSPVLVAILDTGIDKNHEDLVGRVVAEVDFSGSGSAGDIYGHGTPIAGIIAADAENGLGIIGLAPESRLYNIKVADDSGRCQISELIDGIIWAVDHGARVINISIEFRESVTGLKDAVDYAWKKGVVVVAAAGNDGDSRPVYPAAYEHCLAVTALQENGALAPLANHGDWVDVAAPGMDIYTTLPGSTYGYKHGTSFATAYVSGLAALLLSQAVDTSGDGNLNDEVRRAIEDGCDAVDIAGTGKGRINVAVSLAEIELDSASSY
jgi:thermitase